MSVLINSDLRSYTESHYPILYLITHENEQADALIQAVADGRKCIEWNMAQGLVSFSNKQPFGGDYLDLASALAWVREQDYANPIYILKDAPMAWKDNPLAIARLKNLIEYSLRSQDQQITLFIVSHQLDVPNAIEKFVTVFDLPLPDEASIRGYQQDGQLSADDLQLIHDEKAQIIKKSGTMAVVQVKETLKDIGGLNALKPYLKQKAKVLNNWSSARAFGVEPPKGIMIVGMPGCGKSLTAKAASKLFNLPLLKLDMGSLMGKYVGESEGNMRYALKIAEAVSPCVLWIDEIEKAFVGMGSGALGSEVSTRMFGYFLSWMQEKESQVVVIATANDISVLPPELLRKGRFDEIFYVDFPNDSERKAIFEVHLRKRNQLHPDINLDELVKNTKDYSGADIEAVVKDSIESAFVESVKKLDTARLLSIIKTTQPLGQVMKDKVDEYKTKFEKMKIKKAS